MDIYTVFLVIYLLVAISLILLILLQQSRGIDFGDVYNIRSSLGGLNSVNYFMIRLITILGVSFFILSLLLGNISNKQCCVEENTVIDNNSLSQSPEGSTIGHTDNGIKSSG